MKKSTENHVAWAKVKALTCGQPQHHSWALDQLIQVGIIAEGKLLDRNIAFKGGCNREAIGDVMQEIREQGELDWLWGGPDSRS